MNPSAQRSPARGRVRACGSARGSGLRTRDSGAVLVVSLIFLAMLTLMGAAAYSVATQEERMTGSARDRTRAFEAAEFGLRACEIYVQSGAAGFDPATKADGTFTRLVMQASRIDVPGWWSLGNPANVLMAAMNSKQNNNNELSNNPVCIAEQFEIDPGNVRRAGVAVDRFKIPMVRIAAHGWGISGDTQVTLQSTYLQ